MISIENKAILIDENVIYDAPEKIAVTHIFNDKIIVLYDPYELIPKGSYRKQIPVTSTENLEMVNRNILMLDFHGSVLWRIKSDTDHYNPWTVVGLDVSQPGRWCASTQDGYKYDLDINTGKLSNGMFIR